MEYLPTCSPYLDNSTNYYLVRLEPFTLVITLGMWLLWRERKYGWKAGLAGMVEETQSMYHSHICARP
jgi:hypothetical protein